MGISSQRGYEVERRKIGKSMIFGLSGIGLGVVCIFTLNSFEAFVLSFSAIGTGITSYVWS